MTIDTETLLADLRRLAAELDQPPTLQEYREHGRHSVTTYYNRFGSWQSALEAAGFESRPPDSEVAEEDLLAELQRIADEFDQRPTAALVNEHGTYWVSTYLNHFGSWQNALEQAGFEVPDQYQAPIEDEDLRAELRRLAEELGHPPSPDEMDAVGAYSSRTYQRRFDEWDDALEAAGLEPAGLTRAKLVAELRRLADELGHQPTTDEMNAHGKHSPNTYYEYFDSWTAALDEASEQ